MAITGYATPEGTARYRDRFRDVAAENHFRHEQNLWISSVGIGTYLGQPDEATDSRYAETVERAIELGANVIDTAANYRFQRSERSIGDALGKLLTNNNYARDELVVCTKGGYLPFDSAPPKDVRAYVEETFIRTGIVKASDIAAGSHCMKPAYLQNQIDQSLGNMKLSSIDVYYIHNPETQLSVVSRVEFENRLRAAFELLERNIAEDKIQRYGVATWNGFRVAPDEKSFHGLERMVNLAREVGGERHGFRFIQLPFNLAMPEALTLDNQSFEGSRVSLLEAARALEVTVVASASILQGKVASGLPPHLHEPLGSLATEAQTAIQFVRSTPGIATALVGMSRREHVEENLQLTRVAPAPPDDYRRLFAASEE